jgi:HEAT repeat protein
MTRARELLQNLALSAAVFLLLLGGIEGFFRLRERFQPPPPIAQFFSDLELRREGGWYTVATDTVGWPPEDFNPDGLRDVAHAVDKPAGLLRVAALGDSVTLGAGAEPQESWPRQLQASLDAQQRPVEVLNVALWGWSTREERMAYGRIARRYHPDVVALAVCLNDVPEVLVDTPPAWIPALHRRSALVRAVVDAGGREMREVRGLFGSGARAEQAWARFFEEVRALRKDVEADGGRLVLLVLPFRFQLEPGAPPPVPQQRIAAFAAQETLPVLDLMPALQPVGAEAAFIDHDHLTPKGAGAVAAAVATWLEPRLPPAVAPGGVAALLDPDPVRRLAAAKDLGRAGARHREAVLPLLDAVRVGPGPVRMEAARAVAAIGAWPEGSVERAAPLVGHEDPFARAFGLWALGEIGPAAAATEPRVLARLEGGLPAEKRLAAQALGRMGSDAAVDALRKALKAGDPELRWRAARALGRLRVRPGEVVPALEALLTDPQESVRGQAARALGRYGEAARAALPALERLESDTEATVRTHARAARSAIREGRALE